MFADRLQYALALLLCMAAQSLAGDAEKDLAAAGNAYTNRQWDVAIDDFTRFVHDYPDHPDNSKARFFLGESLVQRGRYADAYQVFVDFLADEPNGPYAKQALFRAAESALNAGQPFEAKVRLLQFKAQYPHDPLRAFVLTYLAEMAVQSQDAREAEKLYRESVETYADVATVDQCRVGLARILQSRGDTAGADQLLTTVAKTGRSPWAEAALLEIAGHDFVSGHFEDALERFTAVEKSFPDSPYLAFAQLGRGRSLYELGRYSEARWAISEITSPPEQLEADVRLWLDLAQRAQQQAAATAGGPISIVKGKAGTESPAPATSPKVRPSDLSRQDMPAAKPTQKAEKPEDPKPQIQTAPVEKTPSAPEDQARAAQARRRSAAIRNQAADRMIRAHQYSQAITMLEVGDNTGDDPDTLLNRYLLASALQGDGHLEDSLQTLTKLNAALDKKLAPVESDPQSAEEESESATAKADREALERLHDDVQLTLANALAANEQFAAAIAPLQGYLKTPRTGERVDRARAMLAVCFARIGKGREASDTLHELQSSNPQSDLLLPATAQVAEAVYATGHWELAAEWFAKLTDESLPVDLLAKGLSGLAWCQYQIGDYEHSEQTFASLLKHFPDDPQAPDASIARGKCLEQLGHTDEALALYRQDLVQYRKAEQVPKILAALARLQDHLGADEQAIVLYERLVKDYPQSDEVDGALYGWAWALRDLGHVTQSDKVFRQLHDGYPKSRFWADATFRLAEAASERGDQVQAEDMLRLLLDVDCPASVLQHALYLKAQVAIAQQQWSSVQAPLERLIHEYPDSELILPAQFWFAEAAYRNEDYDKAGHRFEVVAERMKDSTEAWVPLVPLRQAQILAQQKHWTEARKLAESLAEKHAGFDQQYEADYVIGRCLVAEGAYDGARDVLRRVIESTTGGKTETAAMAQWMIGQTYFEQQDFEAALREYLVVEAKYSYPHWQAASLIQAGKCYEQLDKPDEAANLYSHLLKQHPETEFTADATLRLEHVKRR